MATTAKAAVTQNRPEMPAAAVTTGPRTSARTNAAPMLAPMIAITRVRCVSPVRSLASAITAAATAPMPCSARPATIPQDVVGERRHHAAEREHQKSGGDHRPAPESVRQDAERYLEHPLSQPVDADGDTDEQRRVPRVLVRVNAEHGQEHEQPEHAQ